MPTRKKDTLATSSRKNSETIGFSVAIVLGWVLSEIFGYNVPEQVLQAMTAVIMVVATRMRDQA